MQNWLIWGLLLAAVDAALKVGVTMHAVLRKRDVRSVIGWVGLAWLAPIVGGLAYLCLGINRIHRKAKSLDLVEATRLSTPPKLTPSEIEQIEQFTEEHRNFVGLGSASRRASGLPLMPGNRIDPLVDGDEAYPAMLRAIDEAERSVSLLSYIFDSDRAGRRFLDALVGAHGRGVEVRVLIDDVGSRYTRPTMVRLLEEAGVPVAAFLPTRVPRLPTTANMRNHRKILVADGRVAFTGGTNIREGHCLGMNPAEPVQCLHFRIEGPVAAQLQRTFVKDWAFASHEMLGGDAWFPDIERVGAVWARGIEHGPDENFEKLVHVISAALASARGRVRVFTPYFLPQASLIEALNVTSMRGVDVEVFLPEVNNIKLVQWATTAQLWQNLEKGCRVFTTPPPFDHTKLMVVDDLWTLLGSTNWDPRSLRLNFEFNVECYSSDLAARVNAILDEKAAQATEVTLESLQNLGLPTRLRNGIARMFSPYL